MIKKEYKKQSKEIHIAKDNLLQYRVVGEDYDMLQRAPESPQEGDGLQLRILPYRQKQWVYCRYSKSKLGAKKMVSGKNLALVGHI